MALRLALEALAAAQGNTFTTGGRVMVSASVAGKSFSYQLAPGMNPAKMAETALTAWRMIKDYTTPAQVEAFLSNSTGQCSYPVFTQEMAINE